MNDIEVRMECLRLAADQINRQASFVGFSMPNVIVVQLAAEFHAFAKGATVPSLLKVVA